MFRNVFSALQPFQDQVCAVRLDAFTLATTSFDALRNPRADSQTTGDQVMLVCVGERGLSFGSVNGDFSHTLCAGWTGVLAMRSGFSVHTGDARQIELPDVNLAKLQVFMDRACDGVTTASNAAYACLPVPAEHLASAGALERWYVAQCMAGNPEHHQFACWLRQSERYQLVAFLLREGVSGGKLCELASRYGVSISHFRRLCHHALGGAAKPQLRGWRTAQALLAISPHETLTDIALTFGFSSPSHFSKDIRDLLGVSPSSLNDITRLSSK